MAFNNSLEDLQVHIKLITDVTTAPIIAQEPIITQERLDSILGTALVSEIETWSTESNTKLQIFSFMQRLMAKWCLLAAIPEAEVLITDGGINRGESEFQKTAYASQIDRLSKRLDEDGYAMLEAIIQKFFATSGLSTNWENAPIYIAFSNRLFKSAADFSNYVTLKRKISTFMAILPVYRDVHHRFFDSKYEQTFKDSILGTDSTNQNIVDFRYNIKAAIAYRTIYESLRLNLVTIDNDGVYFASAGNDTSFNNREQVKETLLNAQLTTYKTNAEMKIDECERLFNVINNITSEDSTNNIFYA